MSAGNRSFIALQRLLPQHGLSRLVGWLAGSRLRVISGPFIYGFARAYDVDLEEAAADSLSDFDSFNAFFTRPLRAGARPLAGGDETAVSPADGTVSQAGAIEAGRLLQAKGHSYSLEALLGDRDAAASFDGGTFATVYLAPSDYHRVHLPVAGRLRLTRAIPGALYSVNATTEAGIDGLFARNERLVCHFETTRGAMAVVLVGAMIVAGIDTAWNGPASPYGTVETTNHGDLAFERGAEIGRFFLGSTVIVCFQAGRATPAPGVAAGTTIRMGERLFDLR